MDNQKVYAMVFSKVYPLYVAKAERKGRYQSEVDTIIHWLTGYEPEALQKILETDTTFQKFFQNAPAMNPARHQIKGSICGVKIAEIEDPLMKEIRYLDKLIDELAKGKSMERILGL